MLRFDIYIRGFGPGKETGAERLARAFGLPLARAQELVRSLPRTVKRGVPQAQIERYARLLDEIGADCELRPSPLAPAQVIAIGSAGNTLADALEQDGGTLTLPPPAEEEPAWRPPPAPAEPFRLEATVLGTSDTLRQPSAAVEDESLRASHPGSTWVEGRRSTAGARDPNDTLVESRPPGSLAGPLPPPPARAPAPVPLPRFEQSERRAPDARVVQMHAPTVRSFNTLTEQAAPAATETLHRDQPWPSAAAAAPAPYPPGSRPVERTQPQAAPAPFASRPMPERDVPEPFPVVAPPQYPVVASIAAPAPAPAPAPAFAPASQPQAPALSQAWMGIAPAGASEHVPGAARAAERGSSHASVGSAPGSVAVAAGAFELPLIGREEYAVLAAQAQEAGQAAGVRGLEPPVVHAPGVWEGRVAPASGRPPPAGLPPTALQGALRASTRPAPMATPVRETELPPALRWALRIGMGIALFVIVGTLRQCRAVNDDVEQALARWEVRPSAQGGSLEGSDAPDGTATPRAALGPVASEWLKLDLHQVASGDKDRARGLVQRFEAAGAVEVFVGTISDMGMMKVAGELLVLLPADTGRRAAVIEVHQGMLRAMFGGFAPPSRPEGDLLRVTL